MVILITHEDGQMDMLEALLQRKNIPYVTHPTQKNNMHTSYGFNPPYLIVDGVPLDTEHSFKYLEDIGGAES